MIMNICGCWTVVWTKQATISAIYSFKVSRPVHLLTVTFTPGFRHAEEICLKSDYSQCERAQGDIRGAETVYKG